MIISVEELRRYIVTNETDEFLSAKMKSIEIMIRKYTNNNFQVRSFRKTANIAGGLFIVEGLTPFNSGDTVQITESDRNEGLYVVGETTDTTFTVLENIVDEADVLVTKVIYPMDVIMGAVNMLKWDLENRNKVGIQSETISRHSVTYFNMDGDNSVIGYPKSLTGFLLPYKCARF